MKRTPKQSPFSRWGDKWVKHTVRLTGMLLMIPFALSSLASPDLFVLCSGGGGIARIEPFHIAESACSAKPVHSCGLLDASLTEIHHRHVRCTDVGLSGHLGLVKEREKLPEVCCLRAWTTPGPTGDINDTDGVIVAGVESPVFGLANGPPGIDLQSVVLLI
jgi:hypothetical protein